MEEKDISLEERVKILEGKVRQLEGIVTTLVNDNEENKSLIAELVFKMEQLNTQIASIKEEIRNAHNDYRTDMKENNQVIIDMMINQDKKYYKLIVFCIVVICVLAGLKIGSSIISSFI